MKGYIIANIEIRDPVTFERYRAAVAPMIAAHGGRIALVEVRENVAYLEMSGGCQGCGMARVTLRHGVERMIREAVPEIAGIVDVTDHAAGTRPYYAPAR